MKKNKAFTLIELLVVIAVIGILTAVVSLSLGGIRADGRDAKRQEDLKSIALAMEVYNGTEGSYPTTTGGVNAVSFIGTYLSQLPTDPVNSGDLQYTWTESDGSYYCLYSKLEGVDDTYYCVSNKGNYTKTALEYTPSKGDCCGYNITGDSPVVVDIDIDGSDGPIDVDDGTSWSYSWTSTNANSCQLTSPSGTSTVNTSGNEGPISSSHAWYPEAGSSVTLTLECTNALGSASDSVTVNIIETFSCGVDSVTFTYKGSQVTYGTVTSGGGKCWLDRNLGASRVATIVTDSAAYGDLFQWGRLDDGHQTRTSGTTGSLSISDDPEHNNFILSPSDPYDWRNPQNNNLWQGVDGTNNPCPVGWKIPTRAEWETERLSWSQNNVNGAYGSALKLTTAGSRLHSNGSIDFTNGRGDYWSSTISGTRAYTIYFTYTTATTGGSYYRAIGLPVRCIRN